MSNDTASCASHRRRDVLRIAVAHGTVLIGGALGGSRTAAANSQHTLDVDIAKIPPGLGLKLAWRGQPVFVRHLTSAEVDAARAAPLAVLRDPQTLEQRTQPGHRDWLVVIAICPHLGCMPLGIASGDPRGTFGGFVCPCHGSQFDAAGRVRAGPSPTNLEVPAYRFEGEHILHFEA